MIQYVALAAAFALSALVGGVDNAFAQAAFVGTLALAGLGLVLIVGLSGQLSLGHGAMMGLGAYAQAGLVGAGIDGLPALAAAAMVGALGGLVASIPGRRLGDLGFAMSTLALALVVEEGLLRLAPLTGGAAGLVVPPLTVAGWRLASPVAQAVASLTLLGAALWLVGRLRNSRLGRAWRAGRDDEVAAAAVGIDVRHARLLAFVCGGALAGLAGGLHAHWLGFLSPEQFGLPLSFELLVLVFVGGVRSLSGALWGSIVIVSLPQAIAMLRQALPGFELGAAGLELVAFGLIVVALVIWRPGGLRPEGR